MRCENAQPHSLYFFFLFHFIFPSPSCHFLHFLSSICGDVQLYEPIAYPGTPCTLASSVARRSNHFQDPEYITPRKLSLTLTFRLIL